MDYPYIIKINDHYETLFCDRDFEDILERGLVYDAVQFFRSRVEMSDYEREQQALELRELGEELDALRERLTEYE